MQKPHSIEHLIPHNSAFVDEFHRFTRCLETAKLVCQLTRILQKHRGSTMGRLSGQPAFDAQIDDAQKIIERLFVLLKAVVRSEQSYLSANELRFLYNDWQTIFNGWRNDRLMHNFEFHSHLIDILLRILRINFREAMIEHWKAYDMNSMALLEISLERLPKLAEIVAQLRGLSTNVAVNKECDRTNSEKIRFLIAESETKHKELDHLFSQVSLSHQLPALYRTQYENFLQGLKSALLDTDKIVVDSATMFKTSTQIVDHLWELVDQNLLTVEQNVIDAILNS